MTASSPAARPARPPGRSVELVLAHAHLRLGSLSLARVELETMAGLGLLDVPGIVDLAEVRWRTGDLLGAGEAANAALADDDTLPVALVIAAEASAALGRPTEARRLADRALTRTRGAVDPIFAGMPRSTIWPADAAEPPPTAPTLFDRDPELPVPAAGRMPSPDRAAADRPPAVSTAAPVTLGLWDTDEASETAAAAPPDPALELEAGRAALVAGRIDEAAFRFGLALRLAPALAPAVLEATDGVRGPELILVRGDAYRLAGHETEANQAYAIAAQGGLHERRLTPRKPANSFVQDDATDASPADETATPAEVEVEAAPAGAAETPADAPVEAEVAPPDKGSSPAEPEIAAASDVDDQPVDVGPVAAGKPAARSAKAEAAPGKDAPPDPPAEVEPSGTTAVNGAPTKNGAPAKNGAKSGSKGAATPPTDEDPVPEAVTPDGAPD